MKKLVIVLIVLVISFMCGSAEAQRGRAGKVAPSKSKMERKAKMIRKDPMMAALFGLVPGGGQFYNGEIPKGFMFAGGGLLSLLFMLHTGTKEEKSEVIYPPPLKSYHDMLWIGIFGLLIVQGGGAADAYFTAIEINKGVKVKSDLYMDKFGVKLSYYF